MFVCVKLSMKESHRNYVLAIRQENDTSNNFSMPRGLCNHLSSHKVINADGLVRE